MKNENSAFSGVLPGEDIEEVSQSLGTIIDELQTLGDCGIARS